MANNHKKEIVQRIVRNMLDTQILRMVQAQPLWGYKIKKMIESNFQLKIRHGALYPTLNSLEESGYLKSAIQTKAGRARKVYTITEKGTEHLQTYYNVLKEQVEGKDFTNLN
jgi:DNA-binding PadR family transcriptional regulator